MYLYFFVYFVLLALVGQFLYRFPKGSFLLWLNRGHTPLKDVFFKYYTNLGETYSYLIPLGLSLYYEWFPWWSVIVLLLMESGTVHFFKKLVRKGEYRPKRYFRQMIDLHYVKGVKVHRINSFPSGHSATAFAITNYLNLFIDNPLIGILLIVIAVLIGLSRIYLCQHFLRDVFAGSMVGFISALIVKYLVHGDLAVI